jgi:pterin-4a-carbinolamine dehydratase
MTGLAFISYRREDSAQLSQGLYLQLKARFGSGQLFMDVNSVPVAQPWPERIRNRLKQASVVIAVIGPGWLRAADQFGRRRLDSPEDWVHEELATALTEGKPIIPLVLDDFKNAPPSEGLPPPLMALSKLQARVLRSDPAHWADDMLALCSLLGNYGLVEADSPVVQPLASPKKAKLPGLTESELAAALKDLPLWEPWEHSLEREYPRVRQELRRNFVFNSFLDAIDFMKVVAPKFESRSHHPRWVNEWKMVQVRLTTWDAGNKITSIDVEVSRSIEAAYSEFLASRRK